MSVAAAGFDFLLTAVVLAASSFFAAAIAGLAAPGRLLEERDRSARVPGLAAFLLRDAASITSAWAAAAMFLGVGGGLWLGSRLLQGDIAALSRVGTTVATSAITVGGLLAGVVAWKRLAEHRPRLYCEVAAILALPFFLVLYPVRRPLGNALQRFFPPPTLRDGVLYEDEVRELASGEEHAHLLDREERAMINRVFELGETVVREIMVPRIDMLAVEESMPVPAVIQLIQSEGHSRLPVYRGQIDNIVGFIYIKDFITHFDRLATLQLRELLRPAYFVPETKRVDELLADMRSRRLYLAIVVDEYGGTAGLVTMEDVIEEVVGEIHDELDEEQKLVHALDDGSYRVDAKVDLDDLNEILQVALPADEYDTLGGFLYALAGKIPAAGDRFEHDGLEFTIGAVRGKRIIQVQLRSLKTDPVEDVGTE